VVTGACEGQSMTVIKLVPSVGEVLPLTRVRKNDYEKR
jgi:hypothetical protein